MDVRDITQFDHKNADMSVYAAYGEFRNLIRKERLPDDLPIPLDEQIQSAKNVPDIFEIITYLVWDSTHTRVLANLEMMMFREGENTHFTFNSIQVLEEYRRQGIGSHLLKIASDITRQRSRTMMMFETYDTMPSGEAFLARLGAKPGLPMKLNQLRIAELDRGLLQAWIDHAAISAADFDIGLWEGRYPEADIDDIVRLWDLTNQTPHDDLDIQDRHITAAEVRESEKSRLARGNQIWTMYVRQKSTGKIAGYTEVMWNPNRPNLLEQDMTGVFPEYRNHGLGRWLKAAMLERVLKEHPEIELVRTGNADSNAPMLKINLELGFKPYIDMIVWQIDTDSVVKYLEIVR